MSLLLAVETSSDEYQIVLGRNGQKIFDSAQDSCDVRPRDLAGLVSFGLKSAEARVGDITAVAINIGPGGLSYVRAGVSFVNALAFSLGILIYPFNYFEIVAQQAGELTALPVLCIVPAANENAYIGLIDNQVVKVMRFGPLSSTVSNILPRCDKLAIAGRNRHLLKSFLNGIDILDTGIQRPNACVLYNLGFAGNGHVAVPQVSPLNDQSEEFYE